MALGHSAQWGGSFPGVGSQGRVLPLTPTCCPQPSQAAGGGTANHGPGPQVPDGLRGGGSHLSGPFWAMAPSLGSPSPPSQAALSHLLGAGKGLGLLNSACCHSHNFALLFSPPPLPHCAISAVSPTVPSHPTLPHTPCSKCGDLEEELKIVTNNLKSLEAQADKVEGGRGAVRMGSFRGGRRWAQAGQGRMFDGDKIRSSLWGSVEE